MADEEIPKPAITNEEIANFLEAKKARPECLSCGENRWMIYSQVGDARPVLMTMSESRGIANTHVAYSVWLFCKNCGFVRTHLRDTILEWIAEREAKASEESQNDG